MPTFLRDLRFALRLLAKTPGFSCTAIAILALGIGVNTGVFSLVYEAIFSPRAFPRAEEVVQIHAVNAKTKDSRAFSYPAFREIRETRAAFRGVLAQANTVVGVGDGEQARRTFAALVSSNFFEVFEVPLAGGRAFTAAEEQPGAALPVAIASHAYWRRNGFAQDLVGRTLRVNKRLFTIVGIAPAGFAGATALVGPELYFPLGCFDLLTSQADAVARRTLERAEAHSLILIGRLKAGVTPGAGEAALAPITAQFAATFPVEQKDQEWLARPLRRLDVSTAPRDDTPITVVGLLFMVMAGLVLLIACLNLANMLLARGAARRREIAIRLALGGGRARIVRQLLTEGFVLAAAGGAAGLVLGTLAAHALTVSLAAQLPFALSFRGGLNPALFAAAFGFATLGTLAFALGPALRLARTDVLPDLKAQAGEDAPRRLRRRWLPRNPLVVAQIALSLGLLITAALFIRGALAAGRVDTGFRADDTVLIEVDAGLGGYNRARSLELYRAAGERLAALPGVQAASIAALVPLGLNNMDRPVRRAGVHVAPDAKPATASEGAAFGARWNSVGADYFAAMGLPLLRGRAFTALEAASPDGPRVAIIDEALARKLWPDGDALGQRIQWGGRGGVTVQENETMEIVGIVPPTRMELSQKTIGTAVFVPFAQGFQGNAFFHVRGARSDRATLDLIRRELQAAAPGVPVFSVKTFRQHLDGSLQVWMVRAGAVLFSTFGGLALVLAVVGVYGVKAYSVARRTREIGIRIALGATPADVLALIFREGLTMTLAGTAFGLLLALGIGRLLANLLYAVGPLDPWAFTLAPLALIAAALVACWLPARRATRVSPLTALRTE
ncbi:MAG: ABC transporter permease [Verrucomicrobiota bacterium]